MVPLVRAWESPSQRARRLKAARAVRRQKAAAATPLVAHRTILQENSVTENTRKSYLKAAAKFYTFALENNLKHE